jgi:hypothetical protein
MQPNLLARRVSAVLIAYAGPAGDARRERLDNIRWLPIASGDDFDP